MDQDNKIKIITSALKKRGKPEKYTACYDGKKITKELEKKIKETKEIYIYDVTQVKSKKKYFYINDHINKTGKNPLRSKKPIEFIDLSKTYLKTKEGITTTCLGKRYYKEKNKHGYPSTDLCLLSVLCKRINHTIRIKGILINC